MKRPFVCDHCSATGYAKTGAINRARVTGAGRLFCGRTCSGLARRIERSGAEKAALKADYDRAYRTRPLVREKRRAAYHAAVAADPAGKREQERIVRQRRMPQHVEYCRRPEYREKKRAYDREHLAKQHYGPFADAALILRDLEITVLSRASRYDLDLAAGRLNKALQRRRAYVPVLVGREPEECALGNPASGEVGQHASGPGRRHRRAGSGNSAHGQDPAAGLPAGQAQRADRDHRLRGKGVMRARANEQTDGEKAS